jgi:hypothetical protein
MVKSELEVLSKGDLKKLLEHHKQKGLSNKTKKQMIDLLNKVSVKEISTEIFDSFTKKPKLKHWKISGEKKSNYFH